MEYEHDKLFCAVSFALAICRGALTDVLQGENLDKEMVKRILDGTTHDNIAKAVGEAPFAVDWRAELSQAEREIIENEYNRFDNGRNREGPVPPS